MSAPVLIYNILYRYMTGIYGCTRSNMDIKYALEMTRVIFSIDIFRVRATKVIFKTLRASRIFEYFISVLYISQRSPTCNQTVCVLYAILIHNLLRKRKLFRCTCS